MTEDGSVEGSTRIKLRRPSSTDYVYLGVEASSTEDDAETLRCPYADSTVVDFFIETAGSSGCDGCGGGTCYKGTNMVTVLSSATMVATPRLLSELKQGDKVGG